MKNSLLYLFFILVASLFFVSKEREALVLILMTIVLTCSLLNIKNRNRKQYILVAIINLITISFTLLLFPGLGAGLLLLDIVIAIFVFNNTIITSKEFFFLHTFMGILLVYYLSNFDFDLVASGRLLSASNSMSLNANGLGIITLAVFMHFSCLLPYIKKRIIRITIFVAIALASGSLIILSGSRLALLSYSAFILVSLFLKKEISLNINKNCIRLVLVAGFVLPFIYIYMFDIYQEQELLGKNFFSGRQYIWMDAIKGIRSYPIMGSGTSILMNDGTIGYTDNTHNMMLGVMKTFGIIPVITIIKYLFCYSDKNVKNIYRNKTALWAFTCCILVSLGEAFLTDLHLCFLFMSFLICRIRGPVNNRCTDVITV